MANIDCQNRDSIIGKEEEKVAIDCLIEGINAAHPKVRVNKTISVQDGVLRIQSTNGVRASYKLANYNNIFLIGGGNAAGHMAAAVEKKLKNRLDAGAVVTDNLTETNNIEALPGGHPVPTKEGVQSTQSILDIAREAHEDDLVIVIVTGGASALLTTPHEQLSLSKVQEATNALVSSGASISEINSVRKHCSRIKGGRLAQKLAPATSVTLVLSDVVDNDLAVIGSGPTNPDPSTYKESLAVVDRYNLDIPESVQSFLNSGHKGVYPETPDSDSAIFDQAESYIIGDGWTGLEKAKETAEKHGYDPLVLSSRIRGEAREAAITHVAVAEECVNTGTPISSPCVILSGGETTVSLCQDPGQGGPNQEFVTSAAAELEEENTVIASVDTDGIDGATDAAGAIADANTFSSATNPNTALSQNDVLPILEDANALIRTGATGTNINDLRAVVIN